jgi:hypothetical protein
VIQTSNNKIWFKRIITTNDQKNNNKLLQQKGKNKRGIMGFEIDCPKLGLFENFKSLQSSQST